MRALIGQTLARHIRFPCAYAELHFHTAQQKRNYRTGKGKLLTLVLVPVLMLASRSLHSYAFGTCACIASENQSFAMSRNAFESFC